MRLLWTRRGGLAAALALVLVIGWAASGPALAVPVRIVAVGDLHGDFSAWRDIARAAQLVNDQGHWIGGDTVLVQTGDVVDRGPDSLKIVQDLMRLQHEAARARGQVIALVGNHEAMNMTGDLRYVAAADYAAYADRDSERRRNRVYAANQPVIEAAYRKRDPQLSGEAIKQAWLDATPLGRIEHQLDWSPRGRIGRWIISNPAVLLLDGNLFVHGGISPTYLHMSLAEINRQVAAALKAQNTDPTAIINDDMGPLWYRGLAKSGAADGESELAALLAAYGARRIVIGHTPILSGIAMLHDARLIRIDTGISSVYGGQVSWLDILDGNPIPHSTPRSSSHLTQGAN